MDLLVRMENHKVIGRQPGQDLRLSAIIQPDLHRDLVSNIVPNHEHRHFPFVSNQRG